MRGGAIQVLIWGLILALAMALLTVWNAGDHVILFMGAFAVLVTLLTATVLILLRPREALRRGPPQPREEPHAMSTASYGSVLLAVGAASTVYGFEFGHFLIYFGIGLTVVSIGILIREHVFQHRALRRWRQPAAGEQRAGAPGAPAAAGEERAPAPGTPAAARGERAPAPHHPVGKEEK